MSTHPAAMFGALVLAQVGVARARRASPSDDGLGAARWHFTLAVLLVLAVLRWPFLEYGRPLLPSW